MQSNDQNELIEQLSNELAQTFYYNLQVLTSVVSMNEKFYEGSHSRFVSYYSWMVADQLGLKDEDKVEIKIAAALHDIGKIGLSDTILYKYPSQMTEQELSLYKLHPTIGHNILNQNHNYEKIAEIVYQHHEKIDGSGFPRSLKADSIYIGAKIISIVDFYHNSLYKRNKAKIFNENKSNPITNPVSYLQSLDDRYNSTMGFLAQKSGQIFDKKIFNVFLELMVRERNNMNTKSVVRMPLNRLNAGMMFADDYYTSYGLLIASRGEVITDEMIKPLIRLAENEEIPTKILVIK